jgi:aminopeptidase N
MKKSAIFMLCLLISGILNAQKATQNIERKCAKQAFDKQITFSGYKQSSLLNDYDVRFYFLDIALEDTSIYVDGNVTISADVLSSQLDTFAVELIDELTVDSVYVNGTELTFTHNTDHIFIPLITPLLQGASLVAQIYYHGDPSTGGGFFSGISNDSSPWWGNQVTWTLSEPFNANQWWPCKQILTDKADSSWVFITTANTNKAGSNGLLVATVPLAGNKLRYEWKTKYPMDYYLISAAVAQYVDYSIYAHPTGTTDSLLIQNYVYDNPATLPYFQNDINQTADFIELYSDLFGLYPFINEKYGHCMAPMGGGMEHQTMTTLSSFSFYLTCHELGHMWFGDNVTCATWSDIWVNEGFASYCEYLAAQYLDSYAEAQSHMLDVHNNVKSQSGGSVYVPPAETNDENRIFDSRLSYDKGSAIIHMIRFEMQNDSMFFATLKNYQTEFGDSTATGLDFKGVAEDVSGLDFTDFFNQWYFGEGYPTYHILWHQQNDSLFFTATQTTSTGITPLFKMLMEYKVIYSGGDTLIRVYQTNNVNSFAIPINKTVTGMVVDPNNWVIDGTSSVIASIEETNNPLFFTIAPNPCQEKIEVFMPNDFDPETILSVIDMTGRIIIQMPALSRNSIDVNNLEAGVYAIMARSDKHQIIQKFVKY